MRTRALGTSVALLCGRLAPHEQTNTHKHTSRAKQPPDTFNFMHRPAGRPARTHAETHIGNPCTRVPRDPCFTAQHRIKLKYLSMRADAHRTDKKRGQHPRASDDNPKRIPESQSVVMRENRACGKMEERKKQTQTPISYYNSQARTTQPHTHLQQKSV